MPMDVLTMTNSLATCEDAVEWSKGLPPPEGWALVGSAALYGSGNDVDVAALYREPPSILGDWELCGKAYPDSTFTAYRKGKVNLLVFTNKVEFHKMIAAQRACEYLTLTGLLPQDNKALRVSVFQAVRGVVL